MRVRRTKPHIETVTAVHGLRSVADSSECEPELTPRSGVEDFVAGRRWGARGGASSPGWVVIAFAMACAGEAREAGERDPGASTGDDGVQGTVGFAEDDGTDDDGDGGDDGATDDDDDDDETGDETGDGIKLDVAGSADLGDAGPMSVTCDDVRELPTNQGCEFWAVDLPNVSVINPPGLITPPAEQTFAVVVSNPSQGTGADVEIFEGAGEVAIDSGPVPASTMRVFSLPSLNITPGVTSDDGTAYRIESDVPIVAYQFQPLDNSSPVYSNDATILFPTHVLGGDYSAITGDATLVSDDGFSSSDDNTGAFVSVVATEDATTVTLYPTTQLHPGDVDEVMLDRGQVLTAISSERGEPGFGNLSGTRVEADAPVAVFSGSVATSEPSAADACCADHVEHQMLPLTAWGRSYAAAPTPAAVGPGNDESLFRITGAFDDTALVYDPLVPDGAPTEIDAYETVSFVTDVPFTVRAVGEEDSFAVAQFMLSNQYFSPLLRPGDPSMMLLPATAQMQERYAFLVPQGYATNFVTVVRPVGSEVTLDGLDPAEPYYDVGTVDGNDFEYAHLPVAGGSHVLEGDAPFGIIVAGHAQDVSYGYVGGSGVGSIGSAPPPPG